MAGKNTGVESVASGPMDYIHSRGRHPILQLLYSWIVA
jgi:hypothetical protein